MFFNCNGGGTTLNPVCVLILHAVKFGGVGMEGSVEVMTDNQWDGMIKMVMMIVGKCKTTDKALEELKMLLRDKQEADAIIKELKNS